MKKRLLAVLMSSAMLMSALAGCGGSTAKTNNGGDTADQTTQQDYHIKVILKRSHPSTGSMSATAASRPARIWA